SCRAVRATEAAMFGFLPGRSGHGGRDVWLPAGPFGPRRPRCLASCRAVRATEAAAARWTRSGGSEVLWLLAVGCWLVPGGVVRCFGCPCFGVPVRVQGVAGLVMIGV
ncbi:MAG: hypothetical protein V3V01_10920, partial [Acidimicrobiales bacterium]